MGCVCAKGKPTLTIAINKTSEKDEENSILNNALKDENNNENLSNVNNNNSFHNNNSCNNIISIKSKNTREKLNSNIIRINHKKSGNQSSEFNSSGSDDSGGTPLNKNSNIILKRNNKTHQIVNNNSLITALPSFNEFNNVIIEQIPTDINNNTLHINSNNANNNCVYIDCFSKKRVELSFCKNNLSNRNTNKLSISNSSLSYDHTPSFSEDNNSNSKGIVNVTNITNININPIIVSKNVPSNNTMPTKNSPKKI